MQPISRLYLGSFARLSFDYFDFFASGKNAEFIINICSVSLHQMLFDTQSGISTALLCPLSSTPLLYKVCSERSACSISVCVDSTAYKIKYTCGQTWHPGIHKASLWLPIKGDVKIMWFKSQHELSTLPSSKLSTVIFPPFNYHCIRSSSCTD